MTLYQPGLANKLFMNTHTVVMCGRTYVFLYFDSRVFVFALPLPIPPLNGIFRFSGPVSFKEINCLPPRIRLILNDTRRT